MKIAPPPRPVPHSTRSPATPSSRTMSRHVSRCSSRARPIVGVRERRTGATRVGRAAAPALVEQARVPLQLHLARRDRRASAGSGVSPRSMQRREVLEAQLVLEVELVEQRTLRAGRGSGCADASSRVSAAVVVVVLEEDRLEARSTPRARAARPCPRRSRSRSSTLASSGCSLQPLFLDDDREPEVDRQTRRGAAAGRTRR